MNYSKWLIGVVILTWLANLKAAESQTPTSLRECPEKCGEVTIPYPFGIGLKCSHDAYFNLTCDEASHPSDRKLTFNRTFEILNISLLDAQVRTTNYVSRDCYKSSGARLFHNTPYSNWPKFTINITQNWFAAIGCDTYAYFEGERSLNRSYTTGCLTRCNNPIDVDNGTCSGSGCCQTEIPKDVHDITVEAYSFDNYTSNSISREFTRCSSAFVVAKDAFNFSLANLTMSPDHMPDMLPMVYDWTIGNKTCSEAREKRDCLCCDNHRSTCHDSDFEGYRCSCLPGYAGNPYLRHGSGCQDVDECSHGGIQDCKTPAVCVNTEGSFQCQCPKGYQGSGRTQDPCVRIQKNTEMAMKIILDVAGSIILMLILGFLLHWYHGQKQLTKMQDTFFRQNGGLILHERLSKRDPSVDFVKIFTVEDLEKATNNYSENNIVGRGGFGMVYKGVLPNNQMVAIKKSLKVDAKQVDQFINEVLVLSQVNNRNVVKLLGCCLATEVPLLVYEFIRNGTLYEHLHDEVKASILSWNIRLRIAIEVAEVLAYLHTTVSTPIIHRDIKSMNILLDEKYVAKVSDFGASRLVPIDQDQVATMVLGTRGYLDPEYMQTGELNEKSDVYSFGVVLVELLTRRKVLSVDKPEHEKYLSILFLRTLKEQRVLEIIDEKIISQGAATEQLMEVAILAKRCLELKGQDRPSMKEVAVELRRIRRRYAHIQLSETSFGSFEGEARKLHSTKSLEDGSGNYKRSRSDSYSSHSTLLQLVPLDDGR